jgi:hypothetical protein
LAGPPGSSDKRRAAFSPPKKNVTYSRLCSFFQIWRQLIAAG